MSQGEKQEPEFSKRTLMSFGFLRRAPAVVFWALITPALYRMASLPRLMHILTPGVPARELDPGLYQDAERVCFYVGAVIRTNHENHRGRCLWRSLVQYRILRKEGVPACFCLGVRNEGDELSGHAWIEVNKERFRDPMADIGYKVTFRYPPQAGQEGYAHKT